MNPNDVVPEGVQLRDFDDHATLRKSIFDGMQEEMGKVFPQSYGGVRMEVSDLHSPDPETFDLKTQKEHLLQDKFLHRRLRGTLHLYDDKTNEKLDERTLTLLRMPYLTERGTFIHGGNEYTSLMQSRLLPGAYTRRQNNGGLETQFNVKTGTGTAFRVGFEPETSQYRLRVQQANLHLYSLLKDLGVPDDHLEKTWGPDVLAANQKKYDARVFDKAYSRFVSKRAQTPEADRELKVAQLKDAIEASQVHGGVVAKTLPNMLDMTKAAHWVARHKRRQIADTMTKRALSEMPFEPDFTPDQLRGRQNDRAGVGPNMAGIRDWPAHWIPEADADWLSWYEQHHHGRRTDDDDTQIMRWRRFKSNHGKHFVHNPTPRQAYALKNWAIDAIKMLPEGDQEAFRSKMEAYRDEKIDLHEQEKSASVLPVIDHRMDKSADTFPDLAAFLSAAGVGYEKSANIYDLPYDHPDRVAHRQARAAESNRQHKMGFHKPENYDRVCELDDDKSLCAGANDWESGWTWAGIHDKDDKLEKFLKVDHSKCPGCKGDPGEESRDGEKPCREFSRKQVAEWAGVPFSKMAGFLESIEGPIQSVLNPSSVTGLSAPGTVGDQTVNASGVMSGLTDTATLATKAYPTAARVAGTLAPGLESASDKIPAVAMAGHAYNLGKLVTNPQQSMGAADQAAQQGMGSSVLHGLGDTPGTAAAAVRSGVHALSATGEASDAEADLKRSQDSIQASQTHTPMAPGGSPAPNGQVGPAAAPTVHPAAIKPITMPKTASAKAVSDDDNHRRQVLQQLLEAKDHSDNKRYGHKTAILSRLMHSHPDEFVIDDDWKYAGITHIPTGFRIHAPRNMVPASVATNPLSKVYQRTNVNSHQFQQLNVNEDDLDDMAKDAGFMRRVLSLLTTAKSTAGNFTEGYRGVSGDELATILKGQPYKSINKVLAGSQTADGRVYFSPGTSRGMSEAGFYGGLAQKEQGKGYVIKLRVPSTDVLNTQAKDFGVGPLEHPQEYSLNSLHPQHITDIHELSPGYSGGKLGEFTPFADFLSKKASGADTMGDMVKDADTKVWDEADAWHSGQKAFHLVDVAKLIALTKGRQSEEVPLDHIWGGAEDPATGFTEGRLQRTDIQHPILVDSYSEDPKQKYGLVDGRHRKIKRQRAGMTHTPVIHLTEQDIEAASKGLTKMGSRQEHNNRKVIAVDLDGTLAWRPHKMDGIPFIGAPISAMKKRVMGWLAEGHEVVIFTARVTDPKNAPAIHRWLKKHGFPALEVTNEKHPRFSEIWDDRAIGVEFNTGEKKASVKHVLVTGPSGGGKSTRAKQLAVERGLPVVHLDDDPEWAPWIAKHDSIVDDDGKPLHLTEGHASSVEYHGMCRRLTEKALAQPTPHIIEGTQLVTLTPEEREQHEMHLVEASAQEVQDRRINRSNETRRKEGRPPLTVEQEAKRRKFSQHFHDYFGGATGGWDKEAGFLKKFLPGAVKTVTEQIPAALPDVAPAVSKAVGKPAGIPLKSLNLGSLADLFRGDTHFHPAKLQGILDVKMDDGSILRDFSKNNPEFQLYSPAPGQPWNNDVHAVKGGATLGMRTLTGATSVPGLWHPEHGLIIKPVVAPHNLTRAVTNAPGWTMPVSEPLPWIKSAMVKEAGEAGCLMAKFGDSDARQVIEFENEHIPEDQLAGDGYERDVHVTLVYGFTKDFDHKNMWDKFFENHRKPIHVKLGKIKRFKASEQQPDSDVLVIEVDSPELADLHYGLRKRYPSINCTYPDYSPHVTLGYVKPGACPDLDGHDYFKGHAYLLDTLYYSTPGRSEKAYYKLEK